MGRLLEINSCYDCEHLKDGICEKIDFHIFKEDLPFHSQCTLPKTTIKYIVFGGSKYYPKGGAGDIISIESDFEFAKESVISYIFCGDMDWVQIFDIEKCKVIYERIR